MHPRTVALGAAARWARRIDALPLLACDPASATDAWPCALDLRRAGERYLATIDVPDPRTAAVLRFSAASSGQVGSIDALRLAIDDFGLGGFGDALRTPPPQQVAALNEIVRMADGVAVRSWAELARLRELIGTIERPVFVVVAPDPEVPTPQPVTPQDIVVWAPAESIGSLGIYFTALQDVGLPVAIAAAQTAPAFDRFRFVDAGERAAALARARIIIDATCNDPGVALALAAWGRPLAVSVGAGAGELLDGVVLYESWSRRSLLAACGDALALGAPSVRALPAVPPAPAPSPLPAAAPLISVVIATYNRPESLDATLATVDRQTYPNVEVLVVNDFGADVSAVVAAHRNVRLLQTARNGGPAAARNAGYREARGEYLIFFDDDDEMFPDHLAELAGALERSGCDVAYGQMVNGMFACDARGSYQLDGFQAFDAILDHAEMEWNCGLAVTAVMFRRRIVAEVGEVDETLVGASDYEFYLRLTRGRLAVRVPAVTSLYRWRTDDSNMSARARGRLAQAHRHIYARHPTQRALIRAGRDELLTTMQQGADQDAPWPSWAIEANAGGAGAPVAHSVQNLTS